MSKIIAVEGIDGSGKTTLSLKLIETIQRHDKSAQYISKQYQRPVRNIYKELMDSEKFISPELSLLLGMADYKYVEEKNLDENKDFIVYDRCFVSTLVDSLSLGLDIDDQLDFLLGLYKFPNIILFMDIDAEKAVNRKDIISLAEAGGKPLIGCNIRESFIKFQNKNYKNYHRILNILSPMIEIAIIKSNYDIDLIYDSIVNQK